MNGRVTTYKTRIIPASADPEPDMELLVNKGVPEPPKFARGSDGRFRPTSAHSWRGFNHFKKQEKGTNEG
jgi:hypothetical protein